MWISIVKPKITRKHSKKHPKNERNQQPTTYLPREYWIPEYKLSWDLIFTFSLAGVGFAPCCLSVSPLLGMSKGLAKWCGFRWLKVNRKENLMKYAVPVHRYMCKESRKNRESNDEKVGQQAEKTRPVFDNVKQDSFQFVSIWFWHSKCCIIPNIFNKYEAWSFI